MKTIFLLESVDLENKAGILLTKPELPKNGKWTKYHVSLSNLLVDIISRQQQGLKPKGKRLMLGDTYVGTKFISNNTSRNYEENPFKLVEYVPGEGSDIPHNFKLRTVHENGSRFKIVTDLYNNKEKQWSWAYLRASEYLRNQIVVSLKKLEDVHENTVIITEESYPNRIA